MSRKRGGWLDGVNDETAALGDVLFQTRHKPGDPDGLPVIGPVFKRSNPFLGIPAEDGSTLFQSFHQPQSGEEEVQAATGGGKTGAGERSGKSRGTAGAGKRKAAPKGGRSRAKKPAKDGG